jgi:hypothetical protein
MDFDRGAVFDNLFPSARATAAMAGQSAG